MVLFEQIISNKNWDKRLRKDLSSDRYEHTLRVAKTAYKLAIDHHIDPRKATVAGYLHDCAKNYTDKKLLKYAEKYHMAVSKAEKRNTDLLHARVGAYIARDVFHVTNPDIFNAISYHTTGRPSMSILEKIIYISDYIEPGRKHKGRIELIRQTARKDLDQAVLYILEDTLEYLDKKSKTKDPRTKEAYHYYKELRKDK